MPSIPEVHALPAPPIGGISGPLPLAQQVDADLAQNDGSMSPPALPAAAAPVSVATHTKTIGMIHPPPDIRSIVDKTAQFVARNGPEFERRILANGRNNVKFNFLNSSDPYHAYYQHRVSEFKAQLQTPSQAPSLAAAVVAAGASGPTEAGAVPSSKEASEAVKFEVPKPVAKILEPPEPEQYTVRLPEGITGTELDVIKLTAQFVARNGKNFLQGLTSREHQNPTFSFLKPTHSMFTFFTALTDAYSKVLMPQKGLVEKLKGNILNRTTVLERCLHRLEWEKSQERARQKAEDEIEQERMQMALIDWHDFVVVETIEFADDEDDELPKPMTLEEVIRRSKALAMEEEEEVVDAGKDVEMEMDEEEVQLVEESMKAATLEETDTKVEEPTSPKVPTDEDMEPPMRIVKNWKRPEDRIPAEKDPTKFVVSPITGELIPINEMAEHMRISLIDPKYKEQKERMMAKLRETTLATDDEISRNIVGLARTRPDIFGTTEEEVSNAVKAEIEKKKEEPKQVIWDGHTGSISRTANQAMAQTINSDDQTTAMSTENRPLLGPVAPPKLAPPPVRPLPPPPGLALNIPRPPQIPGQPSLAMPPPAVGQHSVARPAILSTPSLRPPPSLPSVTSIRPPPPPPSIAPTAPAMVSPSPPVPQFSSLPPSAHPAYPQPIPPPSMPLMPPPPPPQAMPPPPPPEEAPPPPPEEPEPKRQKLDDMLLIPEDQFLAQHPGAVRIVVAVPLVEGEGNLKGQMLEVTIHSLSETISSVKEKIAGEIALPANKQKLSGRGGFFFKDNLSLAYYNVGPGETLTLGLRERGGRKR